MAIAEIAAIILAAGRSTRFAGDQPGTTKLVAELNGKPLVRHVADAVGVGDVVLHGDRRAGALAARADHPSLVVFILFMLSSTTSLLR